MGVGDEEFCRHRSTELDVLSDNDHKVQLDDYGLSLIEASVK